MTGSRPEMGAMAAGQYGLVSASQLRTLGFSAGQRRHLVACGALRRLRRAVYTLIGVPPCWEQPVLAAVLAAGPGAVVSHATAARLWRLKHAEEGDPSAIHLTCARQLRMKGVIGHQRSLPTETQRCYRVIPVTSPEQTIIDLAASLSETELGECIDDALRRGLIRMDRLRKLTQAINGPGRRRIIPIRQAVAERLPGFDPGANAWEQDRDRLWDRLGLPPGVRQYLVHANGHTYFLDRAIPHLKIGIEWNGYGTHGSRSGFDRDSDKRADLTAAGWQMLDFTYRSKPRRIFKAVTGAIAQRQHLLTQTPSS